MIREVGWDDVRGYLSEGGTLIGTARCMAFMERPGRLRAAKNMIEKVNGGYLATPKGSANVTLPGN